MKNISKFLPCNSNSLILFIHTAYRSIRHLVHSARVKKKLIWHLVNQAPSEFVTRISVYPLPGWLVFFILSSSKHCHATVSVSLEDFIVNIIRSIYLPLGFFIKKNKYTGVIRYQNNCVLFRGNGLIKITAIKNRQ